MHRCSIVRVFLTSELRHRFRYCTWFVWIMLHFPVKMLDFPSNRVSSTKVIYKSSLQILAAVTNAESLRSLQNRDFMERDSTRNLNHCSKFRNRLFVTDGLILRSTCCSALFVLCQCPLLWALFHIMQYQERRIFIIDRTIAFVSLKFDCRYQYSRRLARAQRGRGGFGEQRSRTVASRRSWMN